MIKINEQIPDISLQAYHQDQIKDIKLTDYRGQWVILMFYPADFTFVCPTELADVAKKYTEVKELGGEILSVSTDTVFVHKAWHDASPVIKEINFPMLADPTGRLAKKLGVYIKEEGLALRGTFIFNPEGLLKTMEIHDNSIGRSADELLRKLQAAKFVQEHGGEVCPASWKPGSDTLKPGLDLVGKI